MPCATLLLAALTLAPTPQDPAPGEVGKFRWPPTSAGTLRYQATFTKERKLPKEIEKAERAARKAAGLHTPRRPPRQAVQIGMDIVLEVTGDQVVGTYTTRLDKHSLRLDLPHSRPRKGVLDLPTGNTTPPLVNSRVGWVWGLPAGKTGDDLSTERAAIERTFQHTFRTAGGKGCAPGDLSKAFGDHLLPVLWSHPLPSWIGALVETLDLGGEAVIENKQLLRDGTQQLADGYRKTSVEGRWTKASASGFTLRYAIKIEQFVSKDRSNRPLDASMTWLIDVTGEATYSFRDQAWDSITEQVKARPKELPEAHLRNLRDEVFSGTVKLRRVADKTRGKTRKRRR